MIRVVLDVSPGEEGKRVSCSLCACCFDLEAVVLRMVNEQGTMSGYVCDACIERGEQALRAHLRKQAENHRRSAALRDAEAEGPIDLPSIELYRSALAKAKAGPSQLH